MFDRINPAVQPILLQCCNEKDIMKRYFKDTNFLKKQDNLEETGKGFKHLDFREKSY